MEEKTDRIVVFESGSLENEVAGLPATKIFASFRKVSFFVTGLHDGLLLLTDDVTGEEGDNLIVMLDG